MIPAVTRLGLLIANHLWQSTLCLALAALLVRLLRAHGAGWRYGVWLAASLKFALPFSLLIGMGALLPLPTLTTAPAGGVSVAVGFVGAPFGAGRALVEPASGLVGWAARTTTLWLVLAVVWVAGGVWLLGVQCLRRRQVRRLLHASAPLDHGREWEALERARAALGNETPVGLMASDSSIEPGVVGVIRPVILWPAALSARLTDAEMDAIFVHELLHVRRRDNLWAALHGLLKAVFWFHPLLWWLESKLFAERERACDEAVLRLGRERHTYARSILKVCNFCLHSPFTAMAGVTGADLTQRVEDIMSARATLFLKPAHKIVLVLAVAAGLLGPMAIGAMHAQSAAGRVSGVVTDQRGAPIKDAQVLAVPTGGQTGPSVATDDDGRYTNRVAARTVRTADPEAGLPRLARRALPQPRLRRPAQRVAHGWVDQRSRHD